MGTTFEHMPYRTADTRDLIAAHRALRRMACYLAAVTPAVPDGDCMAATAVADLAAELTDALRRLHAAQTELLWPVLRAYLVALDRCPDADEVAHIEAQAGQIERLLVDIAIELAHFRMGAAADDRDALADLLTVLRTRVLEQFADVERFVFPLAGHYMTYAQWEEISRHYLLGIPTHRRDFRTGAMLRECSRRDRARVVHSREGRLARSRMRRAFVREFDRIQGVLGAEPDALCSLTLSAAG